MERLEKVKSCSQSQNILILDPKQPTKYGAEYVGVLTYSCGNILP